MGNLAFQHNEVKAKNMSLILDLAYRGYITIRTKIALTLPLAIIWNTLFGVVSYESHFFILKNEKQFRNSTINFLIYGVLLSVPY